MSTALDTATTQVVERLHVRGVEVTRLDTERFPFDVRLATTLTGVSHDTCGALRLSVGDREGIDSVDSVWYRRVRTATCPPGMSAGVHEFCLRESRAMLLGTLLAMDRPIMSAPERVWAAENKPFQLAVAQRLGLEIPRTLVTNDATKVREMFRACEAGMIAKPVRTGYVDLGDQQQAIFTSQVLETHLADDDRLAVSPVIYQPLIPKRCDVRVTIVGHRLFAAEIDSQTDPAAQLDWRMTANPDLPHRETTLPGGLARLLLAFVRELGLQFGAIDLIRTPKDRYVFLEINPGGQWLWLDDVLNLGITDAVADWLVEAELGQGRA